MISLTEAGGIGIVQSLEEAEHGWMPRSALRRDHIHAVLRLDAMARALGALTHGKSIRLDEAERPR